MTKSEAKRLYLSYNCSLFRMCIEDYDKYMEYRRLEIAKWQEQRWQNEMIFALCAKIEETHSVTEYQNLYEIAEEFHDEEKLGILCDYLQYLDDVDDDEMRIELVELILGKKKRQARSGLIYWAYDLDREREMKEVCRFIKAEFKKMQTTNVYLNRRIRKAKRLMAEILEELL